MLNVAGYHVPRRISHVVPMHAQSCAYNSYYLFRLNSEVLKTRATWASGWLQKHEMKDAEGTLAGNGGVGRQNESTSGHVGHICHAMPCHAMHTRFKLILHA